MQVVSPSGLERLPSCFDRPINIFLRAVREGQQRLVSDWILGVEGFAVRSGRPLVVATSSAGTSGPRRERKYMKIPVGTLWVVPNGVKISEYVDIFLYGVMGE